MGTYYLPRNTKGEGRILYIFSTKSLIFTAAGGGLGILIYYILSIIGLGIVGIILGAILAIIGFALGTMKVPNIAFFELTRKTNGEALSDVVKRWLIFRKKKNKIYIYKGDDVNGR